MDLTSVGLSEDVAGLGTGHRFLCKISDQMETEDIYYVFFSSVSTVRLRDFDTSHIPIISFLAQNL